LGACPCPNPNNVLWLCSVTALDPFFLTEGLAASLLRAVQMKLELGMFTQNILNVC